MTLRTSRLLRRRTALGSAALLLVLLAGACDAVEPGGAGVLVVEGFLDAHKALPALTLRQTQPLGLPYDSARSAVSDAEVELDLGGQQVHYAADPAHPGRYTPRLGIVVPARAAFTLRIRWDGGVTTAEGTVPPPVHVADVLLDIPSAPVPAVLLDSLLLRPLVLDSLQFDSLGTGAQQGFVYPIEVTVTWEDNLTAADSLFWVRTQLRPDLDATSGILTFFLRPEQVVRERALPRTNGRRQWTGVYAIPVEDAGAPLPPHRLKVSLLRSGADYARYATSRDAPLRREPRSNIAGGTGIMAGISVDSVWVDVR